MIRVLLVNIGGTVIAEDGEEEEKVGGDGTLEPEDEEDEDEYVEEKGHGENAPLKDPRVRVEVDEIEVGFGSQGIEEGRQLCGRWLERGRDGRRRRSV